MRLARAVFGAGVSDMGVKGARAIGREEAETSFAADAWTAVKPYSVMGSEEDMVVDKQIWACSVIGIP